MIKAVIFDLDGTLLDTSRGVIKSVQYTIQQLHLPELTQEQLLSFIGPPIRRRMMEVYDLSEEEATNAMAIFREHYGISDVYEADHYPGMQELLSKLKEQGYLLGVATYKREDMSIRLLEKMGLAGYMDVIHGSDAEGKYTKSQVILNSIVDLGVTPEEVIMVGDSDNDAIGAQEVGAKFIGVTYGFGFQQEKDGVKYQAIGMAEKCLDITKYL